MVHVHRLFVYTTLICSLFVHTTASVHQSFFDMVFNLYNKSVPNHKRIRQYDDPSTLFQLWDAYQCDENAKPFGVSNHSFLNGSVTGIKSLLEQYGQSRSRFQLMSDGSASGIPVRGDDISLRNFVGRLETVQPQEKLPQHSGHGNGDPSYKPSYLPTKSKMSSAQHLYEELRAQNVFSLTPMYIESFTGDEGVGRELISDLMKDLQVDVRRFEDDHEKWSYHDGGKFGELTPQTVGREVFAYVGNKFSGSFIHRHSSACASSTGDKLWMLYTEAEMNRLVGPPSLPPHLPKRCPFVEGNCIQGVHPLDVLQHYEELSNMNLAPTLYLQRKGTVFCFPDGMFHGTVNLESTVTISLLRDPCHPYVDEFEMETAEEGMHVEPIEDRPDEELMRMGSILLDMKRYEEAKVQFDKIVARAKCDGTFMNMSQLGLLATARGGIGISLYNEFCRLGGTNRSQLKVAIAEFRHSLHAFSELGDNSPANLRPSLLDIQLLYCQALSRGALNSKILAFHYLSQLFRIVLDDSHSGVTAPPIDPYFVLKLLKVLVDISVVGGHNVRFSNAFEMLDLACSQWGFVQGCGKRPHWPFKPAAVRIETFPAFIINNRLRYMSNTNVAVCMLPYPANA